MTPDVAPSARGFKKSFAFLPGCGSHFNYEPQFDAKDDAFILSSDGFWMKNDTPIDRKTDLPDNFYSSNFFTDKLLEFLESRDANEKAQPFFSYLALTAPHWPMQAPREIIDKYRMYRHPTRRPKVSPRDSMLILRARWHVRPRAGRAHQDTTGETQEPRACSPPRGACASCWARCRKAVG